MQSYANPVLSGFHPDPSLCRVGQDYYLVTSTFEYFPGLPIYHSRDLVHWRLLANALDRPSQLPLKGATDFGGLYAPTLRHAGGLFYLACTNMTGPGAFFVTAEDPAGPWSEPLYLPDREMDGSLLFDEDGKVYYTKHAGGERAGISQAELDIATGAFKAPPRLIYNNSAEPWNEGPHLYKIKGWYYLMLAEGGCGDEHQEVILRSRSPWGPFEACPHNPILTLRDLPESPIQCAGHADLLQAHDGSWYMVFLGVRRRRGEVSVLGRETFLAAVEWTAEGWPRLKGDGRAHPQMPFPSLPPQPWPQPPARDSFRGTRLGPEWIHVRNPAPGDIALQPGRLRLRAARHNLSAKGETQATACRRQTAFEQSARAALEFRPAADGEEAGLSVRANDENHCEVALLREAGADRLVLRSTLKGESRLLASCPAPAGPLQLEVKASRESYAFSYSSGGGAWIRLGELPAAPLSKELAGGFTGAVFCLYASANGAESDSRADFLWFELH